MSRAEQRRLDAEELERQKKEIEKEKAAKRAKAARERKLEKEELARAERRKNGEPEKSRWVRASQPSIATFVRGKDGKRKRRGVDEEAERIMEDDEPPAKRLAIAGEDEPEDHGREGANFGDESSIDHLNVVMEQNDSHDKQVVAESEDEFGDFPALSQPGLLEAILSSSLDSTLEASRKPRQSTKNLPPDGAAVSMKVSSEELPSYHKRYDDDILFGNAEEEANLATIQVRSEEVQDAFRADSSEEDLPDTSENLVPPAAIELEEWISPMTNEIQSLGNLAGEGRQKHDRASAPLGIRHSSLFKVPSLPRTRSIHSTVSRLQHNCPPPSTQAFLEDNFDDFMPTPSQEVRELLEDIDEGDLPSNTQIAKEISPKRPLLIHNTNSAAADAFDDFICTQDLMLSSQDMREISPVKSAVPSTMETATLRETSMPPPPLRRQPPEHLEELSTPSKVSAQTKTRNNLDEEVKILLGQSSRQSSKTSKPLKAVAHNSPQPSSKTKSLNSEHRLPKPARTLDVETTVSPAPSVHSRVPLAKKSHTNMPSASGSPLSQHKASRPSSMSKKATHASSLQQSHPNSADDNPRPKSRGSTKPRFFEEKENDLFEAALHESKVMAEKASASASSKVLTLSNRSSHSRPASRGQTRMGLRSANSSFSEKGRVKVDVIENKDRDDKGKEERVVKSTRTLRRVQSTATDYGDDEFEGLCEEDLLKVLC